MSDFMEMVKEEAKERLNDCIGNEMYLCDLGMSLTDYENCNGSWSCSRHEDMENIKTYWNECADFVEYYHSEFGTDVPNVFENPEKFFCCMMIEAIAGLVGCSICNNEKLNDLWNDEVEISVLNFIPCIIIVMQGIFIILYNSIQGLYRHFITLYDKLYR